MRELARSIAREGMKRAGYKQINKKKPGLGDKSVFAVHWREFMNYQPNTVLVKHHNKRVKGTGRHKGLFGRRLFA